jgi:hypothetical protein
MSLRSSTENEIALTLALSHRNGRGNFSIQRALDVVRLVSFYPRPFREREG